MISIRKATTADLDDIWKIIREVIVKGDTYVFALDSTKEKMLGYWFGEGKHTYIALIEGKIAGTFVLKDNQPDLGSHIANGSYMASSEFSGKGLGMAMGKFSIDEARRLGYKAMQFNIVIKTNERAVTLWKKLGFRIIGEVPDAFDQPGLGMTNAYIMYRKV